MRAAEAARATAKFRRFDFCPGPVRVARAANSILSRGIVGTVCAETRPRQRRIDVVSNLQRRARVNESRAQRPCCAMRSPGRH